MLKRNANLQQIWVVAFTFTVLSVFIGASTIQADPLLQQLPDDGAWVKYFVTIDFGNGRDESPIWIVKSVGKTTLNGEPCRWIELVGKQKDETFQLYKVLVNEKDFTTKKNALASVRKVWSKRGADAAVAIERLETADPFLAAILGGPVNSLKKLDEKEKVDWQNGRLECDVHTGASDLELPGVKIDVSHRILRHSDVPFGVAAAKFQMKAKLGDQERVATVNSTLESMGKDATSEIQDAQ